jgi:hypothetical protein
MGLSDREALANDRVIDVTFRDLSAGGARLLVTEPIAHTGELPVLLLKEGLILRLRIIWARPPMFQLEIRDALDADGECPPQFAALTEAWRGWKPRPKPAEGGTPALLTPSGWQRSPRPGASASGHDINGELRGAQIFCSEPCERRGQLSRSAAMTEPDPLADSQLIGARDGRCDGSSSR